MLGDWRCQLTCDFASRSEVCIEVDFEHDCYEGMPSSATEPWQVRATHEEQNGSWEILTSVHVYVCRFIYIYMCIYIVVYIYMYIHMHTE